MKSAYPRVFIGNLNFEGVDDSALFELFTRYIEGVRSAKVVRGEGRRCFGFVELQTEEQAEEAIQILNGVEFFGRTINVSRAREK
jgi:RNA recognition motif-containing protein